jgi:hypothetical protein
VGTPAELPTRDFEIGATEELHKVMVEAKLRHPGDPELDKHVAAARVRQTKGRGPTS